METLAQRIARDGPVSELDAIGWAIRLAKRLEALHQLGVAHGSVSPACILTSGQDRNARAYLADVQHTTPTPAYQSPERILGGDISTADDVWALASTLYALLTGQSPFAGAHDAEVRQKILAASPAPLAVFDVGDDDLQHILDRAFTREIAGRTASVAQLRRALEEWHPDRGVANLPPLEDEDSTNDDEDVARTFIVRDASAYMAQKLNIQVPNQPGAPPAAPGPVSKVSQDDDDDDDDNVRTVMRAMPQDDLASMIARATAQGGPAPQQPPARGPGGYPAPQQPPAAFARPQQPAFDNRPQPPAFGNRPQQPGPAPFPNAPAPFGGPPGAPPQPPQPPAYAFGGRPAPQPPAPAPADDDDDDDNVRTVMRSPEAYLAELDASRGAPQPPAPQPPGRGPLGPPGARSTALGGFQGPAAAPPAGGPPPAPFAPPQPPAPAPFAHAAPPQPPDPGPAPWRSSGGGPNPAPTMAFPSFDGPEPGLGGGTQPMGHHAGPPEPRLGGGTQPMGGPGMEALTSMLGASPLAGPGGPLHNPGAPAPTFGAPLQNPGAPAPTFGGMAPPGDLSALEGPPAPPAGPAGPPPLAPGLQGIPGVDPMVPAPKSNKLVLVVAALVALLIAAGVTFLILRSRAG